MRRELTIWKKLSYKGDHEMISDIGIERLKSAIVEQALKDLRVAYLRYRSVVRRRGANSLEARNQLLEVERLENWFRSGWYDMLCELDGNYLIEQIRRRVDKNGRI